MEGVKIDFNDSGAQLNLQEKVVYFAAVNQDALVNLGTQQGSDSVDPDRGSNLEALTLKSSAVVSLKSALHVANIASSETTFYVNTVEDETETNRLGTINLQPTQLTLDGLKINAVTLSVKGEQIGTETTLI